MYKKELVANHLRFLRRYNQDNLLTSLESVGYVLKMIGYQQHEVEEAKQKFSEYVSKKST